jgi:hypothetical protein
MDDCWLTFSVCFKMPMHLLLSFSTSYSCTTDTEVGRHHEAASSPSLLPLVHLPKNYAPSITNTAHTRAEGPSNLFMDVLINLFQFVLNQLCRFG